MLLFLVLTAVTFSLFGFIIGIWAHNFEKLQLIPLLIITPLTFLGGSFYSIDMLPPVWRTITLFNPVLYLVSGFRWSFYGVADVNVAVSLGMTRAVPGALPRFRVVDFQDRLAHQDRRAPHPASHCRSAPHRLNSAQLSIQIREYARVARQFIYHMAGLNKAYGTKKVLENLHLSFYPDAKIGILGPNGSGKSTVLKIMAGLDKEYSGEAWLADRATVGYLAQEPRARPGAQRVRQRHGRRDQEDRHHRALQRTDDELLRRDRRRVGEAPGRDGPAEPLGPRTAGRDGDGSAAAARRRKPT